ncbi:hypothetical protein AAY473_000064 [Plecturocebus cupreus]
MLECSGTILAHYNLHLLGSKATSVTSFLDNFNDTVHVIRTGGRDILGRKGQVSNKTPPSSLKPPAQSENLYPCFPARMLPFPKSPMAWPTPPPVPMKIPDSAGKEEKQLDIGDYGWTLEKSGLSAEGEFDGVTVKKNWLQPMAGVQKISFPPHPLFSSPSSYETLSSAIKSPTFTILQFVCVTSFFLDTRRAWEPSKDDICKERRPAKKGDPAQETKCKKLKCTTTGHSAGWLATITSFFPSITDLKSENSREFHPFLSLEARMERPSAPGSGQAVTQGLTECEQPPWSAKGSAVDPPAGSTATRQLRHKQVAEELPG